MENTTGFNRLLLRFFLIAVLAGICSFYSPVKKYKVTIRITQSHSYCGGAQPAPEMLQQLTAPVKAPEKKIFIRSGEVNLHESAIIANAVSDSEGIVHLLLKPGKYCLVDERKNSDKYIKEIFKKLKYGDQFNSPVTMDCLLRWLKNPDLVFTVEAADVSGLSLNYTIPCSWNAVPCTTYHGPLPP